MDTITSSGYKSESGPTVGSIGKRTIQLLPKNPMDKTTIVSIYPRQVVDTKPTLFPSRFVIPAALQGDFSILIVEGASYFIPSPVERQPPTEVQVNSMMLAESILHDSIPTMNLVQQGARPGLFAIPGEWTKKTIISYIHADGRSFHDLLETAKEWQKNYWVAVMNEADGFWAKSNGDPKVIPDDARIAAKFLGLEKVKPWMSTTVASELIPCIACGTMINNNVPVCKECHAIVKPELAKTLGIKFSEK